MAQSEAAAEAMKFGFDGADQAVNAETDSGIRRTNPVQMTVFRSLQHFADQRIIDDPIPERRAHPVIIGTQLQRQH
jgi:hypothetical protein